jgi:phosphoribosyl 1,2-cyclic phosphodiesterase
MKVRIWGSRGSLAAPGPDTVRYGGNTPCVEVRLRDGTILVLDAGTGIRPLGHELVAEKPAVVHLLLSHLHLDHLVGLPFFDPLFLPGLDFHVWGPRSPVYTLRESIERYMSPPLFPVELSDVPSHVTLHDAPAEPWTLGSATLIAQPVSHNGPTLGYRIEDDGAAVAYIPDHEPARGGDISTIEPEWLSGFDLAAGADLLLHDSQYTPAEYAGRVGWGHSSLTHVLELARRAEVRRLVLFHHDPAHSDDLLEEMEAEARRAWVGAEPPRLAREGMEITVEAVAAF